MAELPVMLLNAILDRQVKGQIVVMVGSVGPVQQRRPLSGTTPAWPMTIRATRLVRDFAAAGIRHIAVFG